MLDSVTHAHTANWFDGFCGAATIRIRDPRVGIMDGGGDAPTVAAPAVGPEAAGSVTPAQHPEPPPTAQHHDGKALHPCMLLSIHSCV